MDSSSSADVWIFTADLDARAGRLAADMVLLSSDERARAGRYVVEAPRRRFVAARAFLRETLARSLTVDPGSIEIGYGTHGKPHVSAPRVEPQIEFNLSHSAGLAVLAVARGRVVGVDVEHIRDSVEVSALAARFFSQRERDSLLALPRVEQVRAFFACWTRKEAYIKARGGGLSILLDRFDVSLLPSEAPALLADRGDPDATRSWALHSLEVDPRAPAALAVAARSGERINIHRPQEEGR